MDKETRACLIIIGVGILFVIILGVGIFGLWNG
jgi:hypothetical protein